MRSKECITHHDACNCREAKIKRLETDSQMLDDLIELLFDDKCGSWFGVSKNDRPKECFLFADEFGEIRAYAETPKEAVAVAAAIKEWKEKK